MTKNAIHGGVESLIKLEADRLNAQIIVTGGLNNAEGTCPFQYKYIDKFEELLRELSKYDCVLYHWLPAWAVYAVKVSSVPSVEFVHRVDTAECDKSVPQVILSHSQYVCDFIRNQCGRKCELVPNVIDTDFYTPSESKSKIIGAVTSYYDTKGIDILIEAWAKIESLFPEYEFHIYGAGNQKKYYEDMALRYKSNIKIYGPVQNSKIAYDKFQLVVSASRVEGLPIALLEALSCNLPIIASDIDGHRIINELAAQKGFREPIQLFRNEDANELAQRIKYFLENISTMSVVNTRETALALFSPEQHINGILEAFYRAELANKTNSRQIDICAVPFGCNLHYAQKEKNIELTDFPLLITHDNYLTVSPVSFEAGKIILFDADVELTDYCNIYTQIDWISDEHVSMEGEGIYLDQGMKHLCMIRPVPTGVLTGIRFIIRPNPGEALKILSVSLKKER